MDGQTDNGMKTEDEEVITVCQVSYVDNAKTVRKLCGFLSEPTFTTEKDLHEKLKQCPDYSWNQDVWGKYAGTPNINTDSYIECVGKGRNLFSGNCPSAKYSYVGFW